MFRWDFNVVRLLLKLLQANTSLWLFTILSRRLLVIYFVTTLISKFIFNLNFILKVACITRFPSLFSFFLNWCKFTFFFLFFLQGHITFEDGTVMFVLAVKCFDSFVCQMWWELDMENTHRSICCFTVQTWAVGKLCCMERKRKQFQIVFWEFQNVFLRKMVYLVEAPPAPFKLSSLIWYWSHFCFCF